MGGCVGYGIWLCSTCRERVEGENYSACAYYPYLENYLPSGQTMPSFILPSVPENSTQVIKYYLGSTFLTYPKLLRITSLPYTLPATLDKYSLLIISPPPPSPPPPQWLVVEFDFRCFRRRFLHLIVSMFLSDLDCAHGSQFVRLSREPVSLSSTKLELTCTSCSLEWRMFTSDAVIRDGE